MTDQKLRDELSRIADTTPALRVPDGLYARGRRIHRRSVAIVAASVTAAVALIIVGFTGIPDRQSDIEPAERNGDLAVPKMVETAPEWLTELDGLGAYAHADVMEDDLDLGVGAVAYVRSSSDENGSVPVVVDAATGGYHVLDLPGFVGKEVRGQPSHSALALSPDGSHLAWAWADPADSDTTPRPAGVKVADLTTGDVRTWNVSAQHDAAVYVHNLEWSTNGQWLLWQGWQMRSWRDASFETETSRAGGIGLGDDGFLFTDESSAEADQQNRELGLSREVEWAISDDGTIARLIESRVITQAPGLAPESRPLTPITSGAYTGLAFRGTELYVIKQPFGTEVLPVDGTSPGLKTDATGYPRLVGWIGANPILWQEIDDNLTSFDQYHAPVDLQSFSSLVVMHRPIAEGATIAYRLIDPGEARSTVTSPDPTWPKPSSGLGLPTIGLVIAALFAFVLTPFVVRRRHFRAARKAS
ncbi:hypothetical protein AB0F44_12245 [Nocardioides sp. NPDC023903]|uniref:hypothetical protein n=1 Tax=Nocardioides sp. NPDC023903 TaxID=3157195 RepID=UPI0033D76A5F